MRLRSDIWVAAYIRRLQTEGVFAVLRKRGAAEAGAIFIKIDCLNGQSALFAPAAQSLDIQDDGVRRFQRVHAQDTIDSLEAEQKIQREQRFDSDLWLVEVEDRAGRNFLDLAS